jgi:hypothetical protein
MQTDQARSRQEVYRDFIEFIRVDIQGERLLVHRRMFNVFLWCFLMPATLAVTLLVLVKLRILPIKTRAYLEWLVLIFPVCYSLYILGSQVLSQVPAVFKRGGVANSLGQASKDAVWRERVRESMSRTLRASDAEWRWVVESYRIDLATMLQRGRYLTALAGAVFFLIMQGIDTISGSSDGEAAVS